MKLTNRTKWKTADLLYIIGEVLREHGVSRKRIGVLVKPGKTLTGSGKYMKNAVSGWFSICVQNPPPSFDPTSEEHTERVLNFVRRIDQLVCLVKRGGLPTAETNSLNKPIPWLAEWYAVRRSPKGIEHGATPSPLMPKEEKPAPTKLEKLLVEFEHARGMVLLHSRRRKRAATLEKKWAARFARIERRIEKLK